MSLWIKRGTRGTASRAGSLPPRQKRLKTTKKDIFSLTFQTVVDNRATPPRDMSRASRVCPAFLTPTTRSTHEQVRPLES